MQKPVLKIGTKLSIGEVVEIKNDSVIILNNGKRAKMTLATIERLVEQEVLNNG